MSDLGYLSSNSSDLAEFLQQLTDAQQALKTNMDVFFLLICGIIIFFMQPGFAFLEAGCVRTKNTTNILLKNLIDVFAVSLFYWGFGYAYAYGDGGPFIGRTGFFGSFPEEDLHKWFFQMVFAAAVPTIVSGAMAERCEILAYICYTTMLPAFCYPVISRWAWHNPANGTKGWLIDGKSVMEGITFMDFAGSGVVHLCGGTATIWGAILLGPRIGRFDENGRDNKISGHSVPLVLLGSFSLMFGFLAFNGGSQLSISNPGDGVAVAKAVVNTMISGSAGGAVVLFVHRLYVSGIKNCWTRGSWSLLPSNNGVLAGMVAICAGANVMYMWGAFVTGIVAGILYYFASILVAKMKIDDPVDAIAVHFVGGSWGLIAGPLFGKDGICMTGSITSAKVLGMNLLGWLCIVAWTSLCVGPLFAVLKACKLLRVDPESELKGLDMPKCGEPCYPADAYGDGWSESTSIKSTNVILDAQVSGLVNNKVMNGEDNHAAELS